MQKNPLLLEINTRTLLRRASLRAGRRITLETVPEAILQEWQDWGFNAVWLMGVWTTGKAGREAARAHCRSHAADYTAMVPGWTDEDVVGSPYAVSDYAVHPDFGGNEALLHFRKQLSGRGISLILDFVPNHLALDHPWVTSHPEYFVHAPENQATPEGYFRSGGNLLANGRDPYFPAWTDTVQLDYRRAETRAAMIATLLSITALCDGVRCDMAMLVLNDIFRRTWGNPPNERAAPPEFWALAIDAVRAKLPLFTFIAETYWGLEDRLQLLGFDYTYHKSLYDVLTRGSIVDIRPQLEAAEFLTRSLIFLENHDEPRVAAAIPDMTQRHAAVALTLTLPGARLVHDGQTEGKTARHPLQLARARDENVNTSEQSFYRRLFAALKASSIGTGTWHLIENKPLDWNPGSSSSILASLWETPDNRRDIFIVNGAPGERETRILVRFQGSAGRQWKLRGRLSGKEYVRNGDEMCGQGLYVRLAPYEADIFQMIPCSPNSDT